jgi:hypothetical protein
MTCVDCIIYEIYDPLTNWTWSTHTIMLVVAVHLAAAYVVYKLVKIIR